MEKINGKTVILLSGDYLTKKYIAYKLQENCPAFRVITLNDIARAMEQNLSEVNNLSRQEVVDKIVEQQQNKRNPSIIFDKETLKNIGKGKKDIVHINIVNNESDCTINIPEFNLEVKSNYFDTNETAYDLYDKAVDKITKGLYAMADEQEIEI